MYFALQHGLSTGLYPILTMVYPDPGEHLHDEPVLWKECNFKDYSELQCGMVQQASMLGAKGMLKRYCSIHIYNTFFRALG